MKARREGKEMRGEAAAQEQMVTGEARKDGSENLEFADEDKKSKEKRRKRKPATVAEGWESSEGKECKVLKETKRKKR